METRSVCVQGKLGNQFPNSGTEALHVVLNFNLGVVCSI